MGQLADVIIALLALGDQLLHHLAAGDSMSTPGALAPWRSQPPGGPAGEPVAWPLAVHEAGSSME